MRYCYRLFCIKNGSMQDDVIYRPKKRALIIIVFQLAEVFRAVFRYVS